jgi:hypothetical protein
MLPCLLLALPAVVVVLLGPLPGEATVRVATTGR